MVPEFKTYSSLHKSSIIEIFQSNCPKYFDVQDLADLENFLDNFADENFYTVFNDEEIIGCGGHYVKHTEKVFGIAWVMFKRYSLGAVKFISLSNSFFQFILINIEKEKFDYDIVINTTQLLEKTFNKFNFKTEKVIKNGFGDNLHHFVMRRSVKHKK